MGGCSLTERALYIYSKDFPICFITIEDVIKHGHIPFGFIERVVYFSLKSRNKSDDVEIQNIRLSVFNVLFDS